MFKNASTIVGIKTKVNFVGIATLPFLLKIASQKLSVFRTFMTVQMKICRSSNTCSYNKSDERNHNPGHLGSLCQSSYGVNTDRKALFQIFIVSGLDKHNITY